MEHKNKLRKLPLRSIENIERYLEMATIVSTFSRAERKQVGALIVSPEGKIIGSGYNGTPQGCENTCENPDNTTKAEVIHAEMNAIFNATTEDLKGSTLYLTYSPCVGCAAAVVQKQFKEVFYIEPYRDLSGVIFLENHGIDVYSLENVQDAVWCHLVQKPSHT